LDREETREKVTNKKSDNAPHPRIRKRKREREKKNEELR